MVTGASIINHSIFAVFSLPHRSSDSSDMPKISVGNIIRRESVAGVIDEHASPADGAVTDYDAFDET